MQGKIIKGIAGFYYVHTGEGLVECRAKGIFRKEQRKPLVGDQVEISRIEGGGEDGKLLGNITEILPRRNQLIRPAVANVPSQSQLPIIICWTAFWLPWKSRTFPV
jgi:ribosome biogenesis GTPase